MLDAVQEATVLPSLLRAGSTEKNPVSAGVDIDASVRRCALLITNVAAAIAVTTASLAGAAYAAAGGANDVHINAVISDCVCRLHAGRSAD